MEYNEKKRADRLGCISPDRQALFASQGEKDPAHSQESVRRKEMEIKTDIQIAQETEMSAHSARSPRLQAWTAGIRRAVRQLQGEGRLPPADRTEKDEEGRQGDPGDGDITDAGRRRQDDHYSRSGGRSSEEDR